jgi:putative Holliday junction resolvase
VWAAKAAGARGPERPPCRRNPADEGAGAPPRGPLPRRRSAHRPVSRVLAGRYIRRVRFLGVDLGRVRIGLAVADDVLRTARPLRTVARRADAETLAEIVRAAREYEVDRAVVGLPLNMDGTEGDAARRARTFAAKLEAGLGVPVELFDERLSTFEAETRLRDQGFSAKDRRSRVDAEAAAVILQGWLDRSEGA